MCKHKVDVLRQDIPYQLILLCMCVCIVTYTIYPVTLLFFSLIHICDIIETLYIWPVDQEKTNTHILLRSASGGYDRYVGIHQKINAPVLEIRSVSEKLA